MESLESEATVQAPPAEDAAAIGIVTRAISWLIDFALLNLGAIFAGVGAALVLAIFPLANHLKPLFEAIAGGVYIVWTIVYFTAFWTLTGQTPGARVMGIQLLTAKRERVRSARALVRWFGMNLGLLFFGAGYVPILFKRRSLPDWLARTVVLDAPRLSIAEARLAKIAAAQDGAQAPPEVAVPIGGRADSSDRNDVGDAH